MDCVQKFVFKLVDCFGESFSYRNVKPMLTLIVAELVCFKVKKANGYQKQSGFVTSSLSIYSYVFFFMLFTDFNSQSQASILLLHQNDASKGQ